MNMENSVGLWKNMKCPLHINIKMHVKTKMNLKQFIKKH